MKLSQIILFFFISIPIIEIYFLIVVSDEIGWLQTILLVIITAMMGVSLLRHQSMATLMRAQKNMSNGQLPANEIIEGIALLIGGVLLLTPGFFTDTIGFICLIPFLRNNIIKFFLLRQAVKQAKSTSQYDQVFGDNPQQENPNNKPRRPPEVIEGEFKRED
ncbi:MAG: FxsA family protein [Methylococcales bacterium]|jgi:UPF0716 protein FxsA|nr:FxsA family protein [Methylococcales bacterium]MBT7410569.1 FxsA family protein [Methylococcales bacterium]